MFSSALKSISSSISTNVSSNYQVSPKVTSTAGPWKIYDAKRKSTGKPYSVFVFDRKSLDANNGNLPRSSATALKRAHEEVVERLKKEASSLAKLRHPSVLELVEPVEETRGGGLQFVTEPVTASLASLLQEKDDQERAGGAGGRSSRYVTEDADGTRRRKELEIDELEIQKGLLQISKALEFLHEHAGLIHGNLTPDAILINAKSDWKISGLAFCSPPDNSSKPASFQPINLSEVLNRDQRLPPFVQINLDYTSPDFVLDNNLTCSADMFSLGLLCVALYNSPHKSPLDCHGSTSTYKRNFSSSSNVPSANNNWLSSTPIPKELSRNVLPRLITRRPAQRMTAKEFQDSEFFNNTLVSAIRFLDAFPAKTQNEKMQFLRGLIKVLPSFPKSVMEKKVLPALLEEMKDRELISLILHNVFKIIEILPSGRRAFGDKIRPSLKEIFVTNAKPSHEKDPPRDAGLMIILEQLSVIADNCNGKEFKDDILPVIYAALESPTPSLIDAALRSLPVILPVLDFSTIKNELFPVIATIFSKTTSLAIKVRGLQAFVILCGGSLNSNDDGLDGIIQDNRKTSSSTALDKYTMQEKIVPLVKMIKTKEPAVMINALKLLKVVGEVADAEFVAMDILPVLWSMSLGPLLDLKQFQSFMDLIESLGRRVKEEQSKKLQELGNGNVQSALPTDDFMSFGAVPRSTLDTNGASEDDFERLVKGKTNGVSNPMDASWDQLAMGPSVSSPSLSNPQKQPGRSTSTPAFSWSTPSPTATVPTNQFGSIKATEPTYRTVTPDLGGFQPLAPSSTQFSQPLQPSTPMSPPLNQTSSNTSLNWGVASAATANPWASPGTATAPSFGAAQPFSPPAPILSFGSMSIGSQLGQSSAGFSLPRPPMNSQPSSGFSLAPPPSAGATPQSTNGFGAVGMGNLGGQSAQRPGLSSMNSTMGNSSAKGMGSSFGQIQQPSQAPQQPQSQGLDKYASLL